MKVKIPFILIFALIIITLAFILALTDMPRELYFLIGFIMAKLYDYFFKEEVENDK